MMALDSPSRYPSSPRKFQQEIESKSPMRLFVIFCSAVFVGVIFLVCNIYYPLLGLTGCNSGGSRSFYLFNAERDISVDWLLKEKRRIQDLESHFRQKPTVIRNVTKGYFENRHTINTRRPVLSAEYSEKEIHSFEAFHPTNDVSVWDLYVPQVSCPDVARIGLVGDGGKWICGSEFLKQQKLDNRACVIYSFGINRDMSFEVELHRMSGCELHLFDPTIGKLPIRNDFASIATSTTTYDSKIYFHKAALGTQTGSSDEHIVMVTLPDIMRSLNHSFIDVLKVDVEGSEWSVFEQLLSPVASSTISGNDRHRKRAKKSSTTSSTSSGVPSPLSSHGERLRSVAPVSTELNENKPMLPFGQLLIELHYQSMDSMNSFFEGMFDAGFLSFSREYNLVPTLTGGKPAACEYSFINPDTFFAKDRAQLPVPFQSPPQAMTPVWHERVDAVIYYLTQKVRVDMMIFALSQLYVNFWMDYPHYPVLIFHDDLDQDDREKMQNAIPHMKLEFIHLTFQIPSNLNASEVPRHIQCGGSVASIGYRHMCRFHATAVHSALAKTKYANVEYVMRMDDDGLITSPVGYDLFRYMKDNNKYYGYVNAAAEEEKCIVGLWNLSDAFFNRSVDRFSINRTAVFYDSWPRNLVFYNNFEISAMSLWRNPIWLAFMKEIDDTGGIYLRRWGDAPIHTMAMGMILTKKDVHSFVDIGYRHDPFVKQVPSGLPHPNADPFTLHGSVCVFYDRWICTHGNGTNATMSTLAKPSWSESSLYYYSMSGPLPPPPEASIEASFFSPSSSSPAGSLGIGTRRAALYTFGHSQREKQLASTLKSFYEGFTKRTKYPFVVFHSAAVGSFDVKKLLQLVGPAIGGTIQFIPIDLRPYISFPETSSSRNATNDLLLNTCGHKGEEQTGAGRFFRFAAAKELAKKGFEWNMRFADHSLLRKPITYDVFEYMYMEKLKYGFMSAVRDPEVCFTGISVVSTAVCGSSANANSTTTNTAVISNASSTQPSSSVTSNSKSFSTFQCSDVRDSWPKDVSVITGFEISHASVWTSPICVALQREIEKNSLGMQFWKDGMIHTLCVTSSLKSTEIRNFEDINFEMFFAETVESVDLVADSTAKMLINPRPEIDFHFQPRRFGWLGGDCAASVALPTLSSLKANNNGPVKKYVWLFGDSLVGTSSATSRLEGTMISNTVGVAEMSYRAGSLSGEIKDIKYYWNSAPGTGSPRAVFEVDSLITSNVTEVSRDKNLIVRRAKRSGVSGKRREVAATSKALEVPVKLAKNPPRFWPMSGIAVASEEAYSVRLLVFGALVNSMESMYEGGGESPPEANSQIGVLKTAAALSFLEVASVAMIVENPHEPPDSWTYTQSIIPTPPKGTFRWYSAVESKGAIFARATDTLYIVGSFDPKEKTEATASYDLFNVGETYVTISRISAAEASMGDFSRLEIACSVNSNQNASNVGDEGAGQKGSLVGVFWTSPTLCSLPHRLYGPAVSEPSIHYDKQAGQWVIVSLSLVDMRIKVCRSADILGRWSCQFVVDIRDPKKSPWSVSEDYIVYAAKAHPELSNIASQVPSASSQSSQSSTKPSSILPTRSLSVDTNSDNNTSIDNNSNSNKLSTVSSQSFFTTTLSFVANTVKGPGLLFSEANRLTYTPKFVTVTKK